MSVLFSPISFRGLTLKNRVLVSPMCQYSAPLGVPTDWHLVHLGARAVGGAAAVFCEATSVSAVGRISPGDTGLYSDAQQEAFTRIVTFVKGNGAVAGIQLGHAGRKASCVAPWEGGGPLPSGGWEPIAPSPLPFAEGSPIPGEVDIEEVLEEYRRAARRALACGFELVEVHAAHGYLLHQFLSPLSNQREDEYGGSLENRMRFPLRVVAAVREEWPEELPVFVRVSATDWAPEGGWDLPQTIALARELKALGVDLVDCSSGGTLARVKIPTGPGYQVQFAEAVRREVDIPTGAVGMITEARQAEEIVASGKADVVLLARAMLADPFWALHAADELGVKVPWPAQYLRSR